MNGGEKGIIARNLGSVQGQLTALELMFSDSFEGKI